MNPAAEFVLGALPANEPLYAVLDGARDRAIRGWLVSTRAPSWCLYAGALTEPLLDAAPHLLRLGRGHPYVDVLFERGFGNAWGVLLACSGPARALRRHLRTFLRVRTEDGRYMAFRWYDPRVLRLYLPTCTPGELASVFGPISAFACEGEEPGTVHLFRRSGGALEQRLLTLPGAAPGGTASAQDAAVGAAGAR